MEATDVCRPRLKDDGKHHLREVLRGTHTHALTLVGVAVEMPSAKPGRVWVGLLDGDTAFVVMEGRVQMHQLCASQIHQFLSLMLVSSPTHSLPSSLSPIITCHFYYNCTVTEGR